MNGDRRGALDRADAWFRRRSWLADPALALLLAGLFGPGSVRLVREGGAGSWTAVLVGAVVVLHVAVAFRRRAPVPVFAVAATAELVLALAPRLTDPQGGAFPAVLLPSSLGYLVAAYTVSACADRPWPTVSLAVGAVGAVVAMVRFGVPSDPVASGLPGEVLTFAAAFLGAVAAAWALGRFRRLRADQFAALAERARAAEADRERRDRQAAAVERARIARELHDVVAHSVSVMVRQAEAGRYVSAKDPAAAATALATIADTGREALTDMRALLGVLRVDGGTVPAGPQPTLDDVSDLVARVRASGVEVRMRADGTPRPLDRAAHLAAYRLVQEALTNVVKHAGPGAQAELVLTWTPHLLRVHVSDTGSRAVSAPDTSPGGGGLRGMRERVDLAGGHLRAGPAATGGFVVEAELPVAEQHRGGAP